MKHIALADTAAGTMNAGTEIIMKYTYEELAEILESNIVCTFPTHTPYCHWYQIGDAYTKWLAEADYKFISGTNLLKSNMRVKTPLWNINMFNYKPLVGSVLVGVGRAGNLDNMNSYTRRLYDKVLSHEYIHSVRDNVTKEAMEKMGFRAINTGCITLWGLTDEFCKTIKTKKAENVAFSLNCKSPDIESDARLIEMLERNYRKIYFWPQTIGDVEYFNKVKKAVEGGGKIMILANSIKKFSKFLSENDVDYVGCRLHGGIFCMHHKIRSIIIGVDYRASDMQEEFNINTIRRENLAEIEEKINTEFRTDVKIKPERINKFLKQFKGGE